MNVSNSSSSSSLCLRSELPDDDDYLVADFFFSVLAIVLNLLTCPPTILLNTLIITGITTKRRLQTNYNILLAFMAGTDLAVGLAAQPVFIIREIHRLSAGSPYVFCKLFTISKLITISLCLVSLFHLVLISIERFLAIKFPLRYESIVNKFRKTVAVGASWLIIIVYFISMIVPDVPTIKPYIFAIVGLLVIPYCHISVYFVCRRHMKQIKSEQISAEASAKFLAERKAWKTTSIIIGGVFMCFLPGILRSLIEPLFHPGSFTAKMIGSFHPLAFSCFMFNSLCNPVIYCWRSEEIRKALKQLLRKQSNQPDQLPTNSVTIVV